MDTVSSLLLINKSTEVKDQVKNPHRWEQLLFYINIAFYINVAFYINIEVTYKA